MEIGRFLSLEIFVGDIWDFIVDTLLNCKSMKRHEKRSDVADTGRYGNYSSGRVENELMTVKLRTKNEPITNERFYKSNSCEGLPD